MTCPTHTDRANDAQQLRPLGVPSICGRVRALPPYSALSAPDIRPSFLKVEYFSMDAITGALILSTLIAWGLIRIGVRIGAARASRYIVGGFAEALGLKSATKKMDETSQCLSIQRPWHSVVDFQESHERIMRSAAIGEALAQVGLAAAAEMHAPKPGESLVRMNRKDLENIAWPPTTAFGFGQCPATMASGMVNG
jgi:hypothetical protein